MSGDKSRPTPILAAPIQEYMDAAFRNAHWRTIGEECERLYQQPLQKLKLLWDYFLPDADKRLRKAIAKSRTIGEYLELSERIFRQTTSKMGACPTMIIFLGIIYLI